MLHSIAFRGLLLPSAASRISNHALCLVRHPECTSRYITHAATTDKIDPDKKDDGADAVRCLTPSETRTRDCFQESEKIDMYSLPVTKQKYDPSRKWFLKKVQVGSNRFKELQNRLTVTDPPSWKLVLPVKNAMREVGRSNKSVLIDRDACDLVCSKMGNIGDPHTKIVMNNPGPGIMSSALIKHGAKSLHIFESNDDLRNHLQALHKKDPVTVSSYPALPSMWKDQFLDHPVRSLLLDESNSRFHRIKIFHILSNASELRSITRNLTENYIPYKKKDVEFYLVIERKYGEMLSKFDKKTTGRNAIQSMWNMFFKTEEVSVVPANAFFPSFAPNGFGIFFGSQTRDPHALVVRATAREHVSPSGRVLSEAEMPLYALFLRHFLTAQSKGVIQELEKWAPGVGVHLIRNGLHLFVRFNQLTHEQFLAVFHAFVDHATTSSPFWSMIDNRTADTENDSFVQLK